MAEIFPSYSLSYDELLKDYLIEIKGLAFIYSSDVYIKLINRHEDYQSYLKENKNSRENTKYISDVKKKGGVIWASDKSPALFDALCSSHLSALCELVNEGRFNENELDFSSLENTVSLQLSQYKNNEEIMNQIADSLDLVDGVRTIQILRALSLVTINTSNIRQISIGAGAATKDILALHALPKITRKIDAQTGYFSLYFNMKKQDVNSIVISDNDPQRHDVYKVISDKYENIFALNIDTYEALSAFPALDRDKDIGPRNFIVALRIDHRMLPDIEQFFKLIYTCMDQTADFVVTMGSGFTLEEFQGRVDKLQEIFDYLKKLKLEPILIKLHDKGDIGVQRNTNKFSRSSIATYQILHCKLKKKVLAKMQ